LQYIVPSERTASSYCGFSSYHKC